MGLSWAKLHSHSHSHLRIWVKVGGRAWGGASSGHSCLHLAFTVKYLPHIVCNMNRYLLHLEGNTASFRLDLVRAIRHLDDSRHTAVHASCLGFLVTTYTYTTHIHIYNIHILHAVPKPYERHLILISSQPHAASPHQFAGAVPEPALPGPLHTVRACKTPLGSCWCCCYCLQGRCSSP